MDIISSDTEQPLSKRKPTLKTLTTTYKTCLVPECKNSVITAPDKKFLCVPRGAEIREKWCKVIKRDMVSPATTLYCCEDHFDIEVDTENFRRYKIMQGKQKIRLRLKKGILPHKFECRKDIKRKPPVNVIRRNILKGKHKKRSSDNSFSKNGKKFATGSTYLHIDQAPNIKQEPFLVTDTLQIDYEPVIIKQELFESQDTDESMSSSLPPSLSSLHFDPDTFSTERSHKIKADPEADIQFKNQMRSCMLTAIGKEPKMLLGLSKTSFYIIKSLSESIPTIDVLITLKKIKLNESFSILALQFGCTQNEVSRIFLETVPLLAEKLREFIVWPSATEIFDNLPAPFRAKYFKVVSIIDCLEIRIENPSGFNWLEEEKMTIKYYISFTPNGFISFVSEGYSSGSTDVMMRDNCSYFVNLPPETAVMAVREFNELSDLVQKNNCTLVRPPVHRDITRNVEQSNRIKLRTHIEQVISRVREFAMLLPHACVDYDLVPVMNDVVVVACGLINMELKN